MAILRPLSGSGAYAVIVDRHLAIERAISAANPGDTVLLAGKGHEDYQIIGATRRPFSDQQVVRAELAARGGVA